MKRRHTRSRATNDEELEEEEEDTLVIMNEELNEDEKCGTSNNSQDDTESCSSASSVHFDQIKRPRSMYEYHRQAVVKMSTIHSSFEEVFPHKKSKSKQNAVENGEFFIGTFTIKFKQLSKVNAKENQQWIIYRRHETHYIGLNEYHLNFELTEHDLFSSIFGLDKQKCIVVVYNELNLKTNCFHVDIYATSKLKYNLNERSPSDLFNLKHSKLVQKLVSFFYDIPVIDSSNHEAVNHSISEDDDDDDDEEENANTNNSRSNLLFDLIYYEHQKEEKDSNDQLVNEFESKSNWSAILRPYQIQAIKWMLKRESDPTVESSEKLHSLYHKITNKFEKTVYYHKFAGIFTDTMPHCLPSLPGGILADDMGLGKTLEVLGCILLNPRVNYPSYEIEMDKSKALINKKKTNFSCVCGNVPKNMKENAEEAYTCSSCNVWTHVKCVNYSGPEDLFLCPRCCTLQKPIPSGCTLIVTPSVISHQWIDEIKKHLQDKNLNVLLYKGCTYHGFLQPRDLAKLDICITTYDVLSSELNHVWSLENLPNLRHNKRFMSLPSPLICVEWWRICLDEAQMVHSTNAKCADMASRLYAVNRWCVTGTPIGRSLSDLHGLFSFIREDPYYEKKWFNDLLYDPYRSGDRKPMVSSLGKVLWRTTKRFVLDQINIPGQEEKIHWLKFTPFEQHLYERILEYFRKSRQDHQMNNHIVFDEFEQNSKLDELDREALNKLLQPLLDLRLTCDHPQLILKTRAFLMHNNFKKEKILTMEKSLQILTKKTKSECDEKYRKLIMHMNGLAGLNIIDKNYDVAIELYKKILTTETEYENKLTIDKLQKIHTLHSLNEVLVCHKEQKEDEDLMKQLNDCEKAYMCTFDASKLSNQDKLKKRTEKINELLQENHHEFEAWWVILLNKLVESKRSNEFLERLSSEISFVYDPGLNNHVDVDYTICGKTFRTIDGLKKICVNELEKNASSRYQLLDNLKLFFDNIEKEVIVNATNCHLRPIEVNSKRKNKCELCKTDQSFHHYAKTLFSHSDEVLKLAEDQMKKSNNRDQDDEEDENGSSLMNKSKIDENLNREKSNDFERMFFRSASDIEKLFKLLCSMCRNDEKLSEYVKIGRNVLDLYESYKDEFKLCRQFWLSASYQINAFDEVEMAKIRMRLREPGDSGKESYAIDPNHLQISKMDMLNEKKLAEIDLKKKLGQFLYLQNLSKSFTLNNGEVNEEICPICQHNLGSEWYVLVCGHCYCKECLHALKKSEGETNDCNCVNCSAGRKKFKTIRCPMCRELSNHEETYLVHANRITSTKDESHDLPCTSAKSEAIQLKNAANAIESITRDNEFDDILIRGKSNSTKIEGVVKCLMKILKNDRDAKCLVFSYWPTMLELIQDSLKENFIEYRYLKDNVQKNLIEFKSEECDVKVLLIPFNFGSSGLNLTEATHILLVEPILNLSQELQAIGRIHRIGQTKKTYIHRFLIRDTIEEIVYKLFLSNSNYDRATTSTTSHDADRKALSISDVRDLFINL